jgi:GNAT superfamily N-acetyltransferase
LKRFVDRGLLEIYPHATHGRRQLLALTNKGRASFTALDKNTGVAVGKLLAELPQVRRRRLLSAATAISQVLDAVDEVDVRLRGLRPGDLGTVTARQAVLYADEYGWNQDYEGLVARLLAEFQQRYDPAQDAAWIAEIDDSMVGSIFLVRSDEPGVGQLRLLYVEPEARGLGVGKKLVGACIARARELGYEKLNLWTNTVLAAARHIYVGAGFRLIDEAPHQSFGQDLIGQTWSLDLR